MLKIIHSPDNDANTHLMEILSDNLMVWFRREKDRDRLKFSMNFFDGRPFHKDRENIAVSPNEIGNFHFWQNHTAFVIPTSFREMIITELGRVFGSFANLGEMIKELPEILDRYEDEMSM